MQVTRIRLYGYYGKIQGCQAPSDSPLVEVDNDLAAVRDLVFFSPTKLDLEGVQDLFRPVYEAWGRYGYLGDVISFKFMRLDAGYLYVLDYIGRLAIIKPGLAADLVPIIKTGPQDYYFVGVKRRYNPGKGQSALMGGFNDVRNYHLDTPLETVIQEAASEIGLSIEVVNSKDLLNPLPPKVEVDIDYQGQKWRGELLCRGIIPTGNDERLETIGLKRVYQTTVYALLLDMSKANFNRQKIERWLKAGDDADKLVIVHNSQFQNLQFGLKHHAEIFHSLREYIFPSGSPARF